MKITQELRSKLMRIRRKKDGQCKSYFYSRVGYDQTYSDENGTVVYILPAGEYSIWIQKAGYLERELSYTLEAGDRDPSDYQPEYNVLCQRKFGSDRNDGTGDRGGGN